MSHSSYTASERRGLLAIAFISLLLIGGGLGVTMCTERNTVIKEAPRVESYPEMIDSIALQKTLDKKKNKGLKKMKKSVDTSSKSRSKKTYRKRSPLDEPV